MADYIETNWVSLQGGYEDFLSRTIRLVQDYINSNNNVKVGITHDPEERVTEVY